MFATLFGPLPRPPLADDAAPDTLLREVIRAQEAAGLELLTDGGFGVGERPVDRWRAAAALTDRPVKGVLVGPYTAGCASARPAARAAATRTAAASLRADLLALAEAGCSYVEVHEPAAVGIGGDPGERHRFRDAHAALLTGVTGIHLSLVIVGGNADAAGVETLLAMPYASIGLDLIAGPDNWRLAASVPGDRGLVCGALSTEDGPADDVEVLLWAAGYAASTRGRGRARVGLATASSLAHLPWEVAVRKLRTLGEAARLADLAPEERRLQLDPRAVDIRSAALGRVEPRSAGARRGRRDS